MRTHLGFIATFGLLLAASLSGCGGSSGGGPIAAPNPPPPPPPPPPSGGIARCGIAVGPIDGFGSIILNDRTFDTDNATFIVDDQPGTEDDLAVGYIVALHAELNDNGITGIADMIVFDDNVEGPIESIDVPGNSLVVLGQMVRVTSSTSFDSLIVPNTIEGLAVGNIVQVSGFATASGEISATRIEPRANTTQFEVRGIVAALDANNSTFMINDLLVDFSNAVLEDFPGGVINNGDEVEAKGGTALGGAGELLATNVELEGLPVTFEEGDGGEYEGLITRFVDAADFDVAGLPVTTDANTVFEGGVAADLGLNVKVQVEGDLDAQGVLVADVVEIREGSNVAIEAPVEAVDAAAGTVVLLGITVETDTETRFEDQSGAAVNDFSLARPAAMSKPTGHGGPCPASRTRLQ